MLEDLKLPIKVFSCKVRTIKETLKQADQEILEAAIANPEWPYKTLSNELRKRNISVSDTALKNHRERRCSCWRD